MPSIDQLLGLKTVADLAAMTDEQLLEHFKDAFLLERRLMDEALKLHGPRVSKAKEESPDGPKVSKPKKMSKIDKLREQQAQLLELAKLLNEPEKPDDKKV